MDMTPVLKFSWFITSSYRNICLTTNEYKSIVNCCSSWCIANNSMRCIMMLEGCNGNHCFDWNQNRLIGRVMLLTQHFAWQIAPHAHVGLLYWLISEMLSYNNQSPISVLHIGVQNVALIDPLKKCIVHSICFEVPGYNWQCNNPRSQTPNLPLHTLTGQP